MTTRPRPNTGPAASPGLLLPVWVYPLAGLTAVIIGLVPWLRQGPVLPLQNLWEVDALPAQMPIALLPLNQYYLTAILGMLVLPGLLAGLLVHAAPAARRSRATALAALGLSIGYLGAVVQAALVLSAGLEDSTRARVYLALIITWTGLSAFGGLIVLGLLGRGRRGGVPLAVAFAAPAATAWAGLLIMPSPATASALATDAVVALRWLPAVLVGLALGWCGARTLGRVVAWLLSLILLYVLPAALTALSYVAGYRAAANNPGELIGAGLDVLAAALAPDNAGPLVLVTLAIGMVGAVIAGVLAWRRRRQLAAQTLPGRDDSP
ncbi:hypothetical protein [Ruania halotolerans]|uniref:hypothetical protein n=1 Tax=Ruania halotolerans TaxID=2897773 RepID=UPI001E4FAA7C|nr:hypothetical protein [Ruania halotolerans]UFU06562.1 hypothetical protein LQF10_00160 [Ruania halotolerans]